MVEFENKAVRAFDCDCARLTVTLTYNDTKV